MMTVSAGWCYEPVLNSPGALCLRPVTKLVLVLDLKQIILMREVVEFLFPCSVCYNQGKKTRKDLLRNNKKVYFPPFRPWMVHHIIENFSGYVHLKV